MIVSVGDQRMDITHRQAIVISNIHELGGDANTRDVTRRSGLEDWEVRQAAKQAQERGLLRERGYDTASYGPGSDPKLYGLTSDGRVLVQRGIPSKVIALHEDVGAKVEEKTIADIKEDIARLERRVDRTETTEVEEMFDEIRNKLGRSADGMTAEEVDELVEDLFDLEEYVFEWTETAESYLIALRRVVERELEVDLVDEMETLTEKMS